MWQVLGGVLHANTPYVVPTSYLYFLNGVSKTPADRSITGTQATGNTTPYWAVFNNLPTGSIQDVAIVPRNIGVLPPFAAIAVTGPVTINPTTNGSVSLTILPNTVTPNYANFIGLSLIVFGSSASNSFTGTVTSYTDRVLVIGSIANITGSFGAASTYSVYFSREQYGADMASSTTINPSSNSVSLTFPPEIVIGGVLPRIFVFDSTLSNTFMGASVAGSWTAAAGGTMTITPITNVIGTFTSASIYGALVYYRISALPNQPTMFMINADYDNLMRTYTFGYTGGLGATVVTPSSINVSNSAPIGGIPPTTQLTGPMTIHGIPPAQNPVAGSNGIHIRLVVGNAATSYPNQTTLTAELRDIPYGTKMTSCLYLTTIGGAIEINNDSGLTTGTGGGVAGYSDGNITSLFNNPVGVTSSSANNIYVADRNNHRIRMISSTGVVSTIAGSGVAGNGNGIGRAATFNNPSDVALNASESALYILDAGSNSIRRIDLMTLEVTTILSTGLSIANGGDICIDSTENIYVADTGNHCIKRVVRTTGSNASGPTVTWTATVFAGANAAAGYVEGPLTTARFNAPQGISIDVNGTLYVSDTGNSRVRRIQNGITSLLVGNSTKGSSNGYGSSATISSPMGLTVEPTDSTNTYFNVYFVDSANHTVFKITPGMYCYRLTGGSAAGYDDSILGNMNISRFNTPVDITRGMLNGYPAFYISEAGGHRIRALVSLPSMPTITFSEQAAFVGVQEAILSYRISPAVPGLTYAIIPITGGAGNFTSYYTNRSASPMITSAVFDSGFVYITNVAPNTTFSIGMDLTFGTNNPIVRVTAPNFRTVNRTTINYNTVTVLGNGTASLTNGLGMGATLNSPKGLAFDSNGILYIADSANHCIRRMDPNGNITTLVGLTSGNVDGDQTVAKFNNPSNIIADLSNNLYVSDTGNNLIRKITFTTTVNVSGPSTTTISVTKYAGGGTALVDNVAPTSSSLNTPKGLYLDSNGILYIVDSGNNRIRMINTRQASPIISTLYNKSGSSNFLYKCNNVMKNMTSPSEITGDAFGNLYITDTGNNNVIIYSRYGTTASFYGLNSTDYPYLHAPQGITTDLSGYLLIVDTNHNMIRRTNPAGLSSSGGSNTIGMYDMVGRYSPGGNRLADGLVTAGWLDGNGTDARFNGPVGIALNRATGSVFISDTLNHRIRRMDIVSTPTPPTNITLQFVNDTSALISWTPGAGSALSYTFTNTGPAGQAGIISSSPASMPITIYNLGPSTNYTLTISVTNTSLISAGLPAVTATFNYSTPALAAVTYQPGWWADTSLPAPSPGYNVPSSMVSDAAGNLYIADTNTHRIRMLTPAGVDRIIAGTGAAGAVDGAVGSTTPPTFNAPVGLAVNAAGNLIYVADTNNHRIRAMNLANGVWTVSTLAGSGVAATPTNFTDGTGAAALFNAPRGVSIDSNGHVIVADTGNQKIRRIDKNTRYVMTIAGSGVNSTANGMRNLNGIYATFNNPSSLVQDSLGYIYVVDSGSNAIRRIDTNNWVTTLAGGSLGIVDGGGASFNNPLYIAIDTRGMLYVSDTNNHRIRRITPSGVVSTIIGPAGAPAIAGSVNNTTRQSLASANGVTLNSPCGIAFDATGKMYIIEQGTNTIRRCVPVPLPTRPVVSIISSTATSVTAAWTGGGTDDAGIDYVYAITPGGGLPGAASKKSPVTFNGLTQNTSYSVTITAKNGMNTTGVVSNPSAGFSTKANVPVTITNYAGSTTAGNTNAPSTTAQFNTPRHISVDTLNNIYVSGNQQHNVRMISNNNIVLTIAGTGVAGFTDGAGNVAQFSTVGGITSDNNMNVYVTDVGNNRIRKLVLSGSTWTVSTLAGSATAGNLDGPVTGTGAATFTALAGITCDISGNIYVCANHAIRKITFAAPGSTSSTTTVTTIAGRSGVAGFVNSSLLNSTFNTPSDVSHDSVTGLLYVCDTGNNVVRVIDQVNGVVTTLLDSNTGLTPVMNAPSAVTTDNAGSIYIADRVNNRIIRLTRYGGMVVLAGPLAVAGAPGNSNGTVSSNNFVNDSTFNGPMGIAVNAGGTVYVSDSNNHTIRRITSISPPAAPAPVYSNLRSDSVTITWPSVDPTSTYSYTMPPFTAKNFVVANQKSPITITGITPNTPYIFTLSSVNYGGSTAAPPLYITTPPGPPTKPIVSLAFANDTSIGLSWTGGTFAASFTYDISGTESTHFTQAQGNNYALFSSLKSGSTYKFIVNATNVSATTPSDVFTATTYPSQPVVRQTSVTSTQVTLSIACVGATSYTYTIVPSISVLPTSSATPTFTGLTAGTSYTITVRAVGTAGFMSSIPLQVTTTNPPPATIVPPTIGNTIYTAGTPTGTVVPFPMYNALGAGPDNTLLLTDNNSNGTPGHAHQWQSLYRYNLKTKGMETIFGRNGTVGYRDFLTGIQQVQSDSNGNIYFTSNGPLNGSVYKYRASDRKIIVIAGGSLGCTFNTFYQDGFNINVTYDPDNTSTVTPQPFSRQQLNSVNIIGTLTVDSTGRNILTVSHVLNGENYTWDASQDNLPSKRYSATTPTTPLLYPGMVVGLANSAATTGGVTYHATNPFVPFSGSSVHNTLKVSSLLSGSISVGMTIAGANVPNGTVVTAISKTNPNEFTTNHGFNVNVMAPCVMSGYITSANFPVTSSANLPPISNPPTSPYTLTLVVTGVVSGKLALNTWISGQGVCPGAFISAMSPTAGLTGTGGTGTYTITVPAYILTPSLYGGSGTPSTTATPSAIVGTAAAPVAMFGSPFAAMGYIPSYNTIPSIVPNSSPATITDNKSTWSVVISDFLTGNGGVGTYLVSNVTGGYPTYSLSTTSVPTLANAIVANKLGLGATPFSMSMALTCAGYVNGSGMHGMIPTGNAVTQPYGLSVDPTGNAVYVIQNSNSGVASNNNQTFPQSLCKFVKLQGANPADEIWRGYTLVVHPDALNGANGAYYIGDGISNPGAVGNYPGTPNNLDGGAGVLLSNRGMWGKGIANTNNMYITNWWLNLSPPVVAPDCISYKNAISYGNSDAPVETDFRFSTFNNGLTWKTRNVYSFGTATANENNNICIDPINPNVLYVIEPRNLRVLRLIQSAKMVTVSVFAGNMRRLGHPVQSPVSVSQTYDGDQQWYDGSGQVASFLGPMFGTVDKYSNLYVADRKAIRMITPSGNVTTIFGGNNRVLVGSNPIGRIDTQQDVPGQPGNTGGINGCMGIALDANNNLFIIDRIGTGISKIRSIVPYTGPTTIPLTFAMTPFNINNNYIVKTLVQSTMTIPTAPTGNATTTISCINSTFTTDSAGNLYFAQNFNIYRITASSIASGNPSITLIAGTGAFDTNSGFGDPKVCGFANILELMVDDNGVIYVQETQTQAPLAVLPNRCSIRKLTPTSSGSYILSNVITWPAIGYVGMSVNSKGDLIALNLLQSNTSYTVDGIHRQGVYTIPMNGAVLTPANIVPVIHMPYNAIYLFVLACDKTTDTIYCATLTNIYKLVYTKNTDGTYNYVANTMSQTYTQIKSFSCDADGLLYVIDSHNPGGTTPPVGRIVIVNKNGTTKQIITLNISTTGTMMDGLGGSIANIFDCVMTRNGSFYIFDRNSVGSTLRSISFVSYTTSTYAGSAFGYLNKSPATVAQFRNPSAVTFDSAGNSFVVDKTNHCIRKIDTTGNVTLFAGSPGVAGYADGPVNVAKFNSPTGITVDRHNILYVTDTLNHSIRVVDTGGNVSTLAGHPDSAHFTRAANDNSRLFRISGTTLSMTAIGAPTTATDGWRWGVPLPGMTVHGSGVIAGTTIVSGPVFTNNVITYVVSNAHTAAITTNGFTFKASAPSSGYVNSVPITMTAQSGATAWSSTFSSISTFDGVTYDGTRCSYPAAKFNQPMGIMCDYRSTAVPNATDSLYIADYGNNCIRVITLYNPTGPVYVNVLTAMGPGPTQVAYYTTSSTYTLSVKGAPGGADRSHTGISRVSATFNSPRDVAVVLYTPNAGNVQPVIFVTDTDNNCIRACAYGSNFSPAGTGECVFTVLGDGNKSSFLQNMSLPNAITPANITRDSIGNIYFTDMNNNTIYSYVTRIVRTAIGPYTPAYAGGILSFMAGNPVGPPGYSDTDRAAFNKPMGLEFKNPITATGSLFVADFGNNRIRSINFTSSTTPIVYSNLQKLLYSPYMNNPVKYPDFNSQPGIISVSNPINTKKFYDISNNKYVFVTSGLTSPSPSMRDFKQTVFNQITTKIQEEADRKAAQQASAAQASMALQMNSGAQASMALQGASSALQLSSGAQASMALQFSSGAQASMALEADSGAQESSALQISSAAQASSAESSGPQSSGPESSGPQSSGPESSGPQSSGPELYEVEVSGPSGQVGGGIQYGGANFSLPKSLTITTIAGQLNPGGNNGVGTAAMFNAPQCITFDSLGTAYVADTKNNSIRKLVKQASGTWITTTLVGGLNRPLGVCADKSGNLYIADTGKNCIRQYIIATNTMSLYAGADSITGGFADGLFNLAKFNAPTDVVIDSTGNLYVTDGANNAIRKIDTAKNVTTYAGPRPTDSNAKAVGYTDGESYFATFNTPYGIAIDSNNNLYISDTGNNCIRKISPTDNIVVTVAGDLAGQVAGLQDGVGSTARFSSPRGVACYNQTVYVADGAGQIRALTPANISTEITDAVYSNMMIVTTVAGNGFSLKNFSQDAPLDGVGPAAGFNQCNGIAVNPNGEILITDTLNNCIRYAPAPTVTDLNIYRVSASPTMPLGLDSKPLYTKYFESNMRMYSYIENLTGVEYLTHPAAPIKSNGTYQATATPPIPDIPDRSSEGKIWQVWKETVTTVTSSPTHGMLFYYAPMTGECVWDLPAEALPEYPVTDLEDLTIPELSFYNKYVDSNNKPYYMNLLTTELSWTVPAIPTISPYPIGSNLVRLRASGARASMALQEASSAQQVASSALQTASSAQASMALQAASSAQQMASSAQEIASSARASMALQEFSGAQASAALQADSGAQASSALQMASSALEAESGAQASMALQSASSAQQVASSAQEIASSARASMALQEFSGAQASAALQADSGAQASSALQMASSALEAESGAQASMALETASSAQQVASSAQQVASSAQASMALQADSGAQASSALQMASSALEAESGAQASMALQSASSALEAESGAQASMALETASSAQQVASSAQQVASSAQASMALQADSGAQASSALQMASSALEAESGAQASMALQSASSALEAESGAQASMALETASSAQQVASSAQQVASSAQASMALQADSGAQASSALQMASSALEAESGAQASMALEAESGALEAESGALAAESGAQASMALEAESGAQASMALEAESGALEAESGALEAESGAQASMALEAESGAQASMALEAESGALEAESGALEAESGAQASMALEAESGAQASMALEAESGALEAESGAQASSALETASSAQQVASSAQQVASSAQASMALQAESGAQASMALEAESGALEAESGAQASMALQADSGAQASSALETASSAQQVASSAQASMALQADSGAQASMALEAESGALEAESGAQASMALEAESGAQASSALQMASSALEAESGAQASMALQADSGAQASSALETASSAQQVASSAQASMALEAESGAQASMALEADSGAQASSALETASSAQQVASSAQASMALEAESGAQASSALQMASSALEAESGAQASSALQMASSALETASSAMQVNSGAQASSALQMASSAQASMALEAESGAQASSALEAESGAQASMAIQAASSAQKVASSAQQAASSAQQVEALAQQAASSAQEQQASSAQEQQASSAKQLAVQASAAEEAASAAQSSDVATASAAQQTASSAQQVAAQASAAQAAAETNAALIANAKNDIKNTSVIVSSAAAQTLSTLVTAQIETMVANGMSDGATALLISTLISIRNSVAFISGDAATLAVVAKLTALQESIIKNNPNATASAAAASTAASALQTQLQSTDTSASFAAATLIAKNITAQVDYLVSIGSYAAAQSLIQNTIASFKQSSAGSIPDMQQLVSTLLSVLSNVSSIDPSVVTASAQASAAQSYYTSALTDPDVGKSVAAAAQLTSSITTSAKALLAAGSFSSAITILSQAIDTLYKSSAFKANNPDVISQIEALRKLLLEAQQNPNAQASSAQASAANAAYISAIQNNDTSISLPAAKNLVASITSTVSMLIATGSFSYASNLIKTTIELLRNSPAGNTSDIVALIAELNRLSGDVTAIDPEVRASAAQVGNIIELKIKKKELTKTIIALSGKIFSFIKILNGTNPTRTTYNNIIEARNELADAQNQLKDNTADINKTRKPNKQISLTTGAIKQLLASPPLSVVEKNPSILPPEPVVEEPSTPYGEGQGAYGEGAYGEGAYGEKTYGDTKDYGQAGGSRRKRAKKNKTKRNRK
jgi:sugar lactone lactonase YvrE